MLPTRFKEEKKRILMPVVGVCDTIFSHWAFRSWHTRGAIGMGLLSPSSQALRNAAKARSRNSYPLSFPPHHTGFSFSPRTRFAHAFPSSSFFNSSLLIKKKPFEYTATYGVFFFSSIWQYKHKHFFPFLCQSITFALPPPPPPGGPNCYWLT